MAFSVAHHWSGDWLLTLPVVVYVVGIMEVVRWSDQPHRLNTQIIRLWYVTQLDTSVASLIVDMWRLSLVMTEDKHKGGSIVSALTRGGGWPKGLKKIYFFAAWGTVC
jgi:hypothetical protein